MSAEEPKLSASARKRANKKARDAAEGGEVEEAPAPAPEPKAKGKPKAAPVAEKVAEPKAKAKGKAKAEPKAPEPAPVAPKAEAKAKAKGKAKAEPAKAEPAPEAPKAEAKAKAKGKAAAKGKAKAPLTEEEQEDKERTDRARASAVFHTEIDTGGGGDWEVSSGLSKKAQKQKEKQDEKKAMEKATKAGEIMQARGNQYIPGMAPAADQMASKGGAKAKAKPVSQAVISAASLAAKDGKAEVAKPVDNSVSVTIKIDDLKMVGRLVGPKGANIILIKEKAGLKTFDIEGDMVTLHGAPDAVALGEHAVRQLLEKGYMSLAYDDFEEDGVMCHPSVFPDLIGQKGAIIIEIKKQAKCEITIPATPKNSTKKAKVTVAGTKESVRLGKEIISSIACYGHHPLIHPGVMHKEMEVEEWRYRYLIGSKGSEMRHIQNNYRVKVNIPREHSEIQNVLIVGEERDVDRAIKYIEKVMYEADQPKGRGAPEQATDDGGDDGPVEDWMKPYLYQRK